MKPACLVSSAADEPDDPYRFGIHLIIAGTVPFAAPFRMLSRDVLHTRGMDFDCQDIKKAMALATLNWPGVLDAFLANFFSFTAGFIEVVSERFADLIRRNTARADIKAQTTANLAHVIRAESLADVQQALQYLVRDIQTSGIHLNSTSTLEQAVRGAFTGGVLEVLLTEGRHSWSGTVAGALAGAVVGEVKKAVLRTTILEDSIAAVRQIAVMVGASPAKLMDQYASAVFGDAIDFRRRDAEVEYGKTITTEVANTCLTVLDQVLRLFASFTSLKDLTFSGSSIFDIAKLPSRRREEVARIVLLRGEVATWDKYLTDLHECCVAPWVNELRPNELEQQESSERRV